jgi:hypothetical protein
MSRKKYCATILSLILGRVYLLIGYLFIVYVQLKSFSHLWRRHHYQWRAVKLRPMLGAQGIWTWRDRCHATPTVIQDLGCSGLFRKIAQVFVNQHIVYNTCPKMIKKRVYHLPLPLHISIYHALHKTISLLRKGSQNQDSKFLFELYHSYR